MIRPMGIVDSEQDRTVSRGGGGNRGQGPAQGQRRHVGRPPEPLGPLRHAGGECRQCLGADAGMPGAFSSPPRARPMFRSARRTRHPRPRTRATEPPEHYAAK